MATIEKQLSDKNVTNRLMKIIKSMPENERAELLKSLEKTSRKRERKHHRRLYYLDINFFNQDQCYKGLLHDLSCSGAFIETFDHFSVGQNISIFIHQTHSKKDSMITGKITRTNYKGIGMAFNETCDHLKTLLQ